MNRRPTARPRGVDAITLVTLLIMAGGLLTGCSHPVDATTHNFGTTDYTRFVDNHQIPGQVFMRYPLGRIGLWSTPEGEIADSVTRGLMLYPTVDFAWAAQNLKSAWNAKLGKIDVQSASTLTAQAEVNAAKAPAAVSVNGLPLPGSNWSYNSGQHLITLTSLPAGTVLVQFGRT